MSKGPRCRNDKHKPMWGKCGLCGDEFPCKGKCYHEDCLDANEACCERGWRFQQDTGNPAIEHPGECSNS